MSAKSCELRTVMVMNISTKSHEVAISVRNLVVDYKYLRAVDNISFEAKAGEVTVVIGPNGAGKTTAVRVLTTLLSPDSGSAIVVHGQVVVLGVRGGMSDGVGVWRRPCRRPESAMPAAMVEPHRVVRWSFLTIVIPT